MGWDRKSLFILCVEDIDGGLIVLKDLVLDLKRIVYTVHKRMI